MNTVFREEKKYLIGIEDRFKLNNYLKNFLTEDPHNGAEGYLVRSLYFDTLNEKDFTEKQDGIEMRRKVRLRIYSSKDEYAKLEIKQKQGNYQKKRSLIIKKEDAQKLINGDYGVLLKYEEDFAKECFVIMTTQLYRPKSIVQYNRSAFITKENNIRITFDANIIATEACYDIFSDQLNMYPVFSKYNTILEVKYNGFLLSYIKDMLEMVQKSELSVSKYCLARKETLNYVYV